MTSKPTSRTPAVEPVGQFPAFPPRDDMQNPIYLHDPGHQSTLRRHFGAPDTTIVLGEVPVAWNTGQREGVRIPDLLIAFNVDRARIIAQRGYAINEQGKPPDFALEIASATTGENDYLEKRADYAAFGITEYWRFDPTGGRYHDAPLAGDRLVDGEYQPIEIVTADEERCRGHSEALGLDICWERGQLQRGRWDRTGVGRRAIDAPQPVGLITRCWERRQGSCAGTTRPRAPDTPTCSSLTADEESDGRLAAEAPLRRPTGLCHHRAGQAPRLERIRHYGVLAVRRRPVP